MSTSHLKNYVCNYKNNKIFIQQWDIDKNGCTIQEYSASKKNKVWWNCDKYHSYSASIHSRENGTGCPYCSGNKILIGYNDPETLYPELAKYYHDNNTIPLKNLTSTSKKKTLWNCPVCSYTFENPTYSVIKAYKEQKQSLRCPICSGRKVIPGINDFQTLHQDKIKYWDFTKNEKLPSEVRPQSRYKAWWICEKNHSYQLMMMSFMQFSNPCPVCKKEEKESNLIKNSQIKDKYHQWYNDEGDIYNKSINDRKSYTWKCPKKSHVFKKSIKNMEFICPICSIEDRSLQKICPSIAKEYSQDNNTPSNEISYNSAKIVKWNCNQGHSWETPVYARVNSNTGCPYCSNAGTSQQERELADFLSDYTEVITRTTEVIHPNELDIYLPEHGIAIEFNGLYWHTEEKGKGKYYHYNKFNLCQQKDIQLITIWSDDYKNNPELIQSMILHKIEKNTSYRIFARKTIIEKISYAQSSNFLNTHHVQGGKQGTFHIALTYNDDIVAVGVFRKQNGNLYLDRYATSCTVVGGAGKIMKYAIEYCKENNINKIITYSDNSYSNGGLYETLKFSKEKELEPDYSYIVNRQRVHKFNYRKNRFKKDDTLLYEQHLSESQLAILNGLERIWDCGKVKWVYTIK